MSYIHAAFFWKRKCKMEFSIIVVHVYINILLVLNCFKWVYGKLLFFCYLYSCLEIFKIINIFVYVYIFCLLVATCLCIVFIYNILYIYFQLIPGLSSWRYYAAKRHSTDKGCGVPVATEKIPRNKINLEQLEHFLDFITSSDILKDIPFGEKTLKLSSGEVIHIPNVVRCMAPSSLIDQYQQLCESEEFQPLGMIYCDWVCGIFHKHIYYFPSYSHCDLFILWNHL